MKYYITFTNFGYAYQESFVTKALAAAKAKALGFEYTIVYK